MELKKAGLWAWNDFAGLRIEISGELL